MEHRESADQLERGVRGPAGPSLASADILAVVEDQFYDVRRRLDLQLTRTTELHQSLTPSGRRSENSDALLTSPTTF